MLQLQDPSLLETRAFIGGAWIARDTQIDVRNPVSGRVIAQVSDCAAADATLAIDLAYAAQPVWAALTAGERADFLRRWHDLVVQNADDLALILTAEMGKPLAEARSEILYGAGYIAWYAEEARRIYGEILPPHRSDMRLLVLRQPVGVVGAITPWNFPNAMIARKLAPALAAGCAVVAKPAAETPLSSLALGMLAMRAGLPAGVLSILPSTDAQGIGQEFCQNPKLRKISFTGSTNVGRILMAQAAGQIKKLSLELGGNAPFIVFDDADLDAAVQGCIQSKFRNAGQTCVCTNRIYVQDSIHDAFVNKLVTAVKKLRTGDVPDYEIGPLISEAAIAKVQAHVADACAKGAQLRCGGTRLEGQFFAPTVLTEMTGLMDMSSQESFGPLAAVFRFSTEKEVVAASNDTEFGLASYVYTKDMNRIWRMMEALEHGMVGVNTGLISTEVAPFGGIKQSGLGREGSRHGIEDYVDLKYACMRIDPQ
ncbi:NAD-dependent succinate-semialdehyde dehydrogenase [Roseinatronobacter sp. NSM]|uniref:NAD-dependent succinate-semialdehyde dehydrogenase n=1 Tax=Roseinatronobacter sp. NSM TaxID=3457785 RepID=UPI004035F360